MNRRSWPAGAVRAVVAAAALAGALAALAGPSIPVRQVALAQGAGRTVRLDVVGGLGILDSVSGEATAVAVTGTLAYLGVGDRVHVLDMDEPLAPTLLAMTDGLAGPVQGVAAAGTLAYVAVGPAGLAVVDMARPSAPESDGRVALPGDAVDVAARGTLAIVAAGAGGLVVVDVSSPASPRQVGRLDGIGTAHVVVVQEPWVLVGATDGGAHRVLAVDASDPAAPRVVGRADVPGAPHALAPGRDLAYAGYDGGGMVVLRVAGDGALSELGRTGGLGSPRGAAWVGLVVLVADESGSLRMVDVTNPGRPKVTRTDTTGGRPRDLAVLDRYALVPNGAAGLWIGPTVAGLGRPTSYRTWSSVGDGRDGRGVALLGDHVYYGNGGNGLVAVDVADPTQPRSTRILSESGWITAVAAEEGFVGVTMQADASESAGGGLAVYDARIDPDAPPRLGGSSKPEQASGLDIDGGLAFVGGGTEGLWLLDARRPSAGARVGIRLPGYCSGVAVAADRAYAACGTAGVHVVGVTSSRNLDLLHTVDTPGMAMDVAVEGDVAVVADGSRGLQVLDLSVPDAPRAAGHVPLPGDAWDVALSGGLAFVAANKGGLRVVDVANPYAPSPAGRLATGDVIRSIAVGGDHVYAAGGAAELMVLRITVLEAPPTAATTSTTPAASTGTPTSTGGGTPTAATGTAGATGSATAPVTDTAAATGSATSEGTGSPTAPTPGPSASSTPDPRPSATATSPPSPTVPPAGGRVHLPYLRRG